MNKDTLNIQEDAKSDWMSLVNKQKKKQKGLPALSTLNTNAGNVEHNIEMFNMMQPDGNVNVDASNGNMSTGESCCESYTTEETIMNDNTIVLEYENLPVDVKTREGNPSGRYSYSFGNHLPDDDEFTTMLIDWDYEVDVDDIIEVLQDLDEVQYELGIDNLTEEEYQKMLEDNVDILVDKHNKKLLDYFMIEL